MIEDKANGPAILSAMQETLPGLVPWDPGAKSKIARAYSVTGKCEAGNVLLPDPSLPGKEWVSDLLTELCKFPLAANDDQVDTFTQALIVGSEESSFQEALEKAMQKMNGS